MKTTIDFSALAAVALLSRFNWFNVDTENVKGETSKFCATEINIQKDGYLEFKRQFATTKYSGAIEKVIPINQSKFLLQDTRGTVFTVEGSNKTFADRNTASGSKDDPASLIDWSRSHIDEAGNPVVVLDLRKLGNISPAMDHRVRFYINVYMGGYVNRYQVNRTIYFQQIGTEIYAGVYSLETEKPITKLVYYADYLADTYGKKEKSEKMKVFQMMKEVRGKLETIIPQF